MREQLAALRFAVSFLTRLPVSSSETAVSTDAFGRAAAYFPAVGAALGALCYALVWLIHPRLSAPLTAACSVALLALVTGGLHLDGLADLFDGLGGYRGDRKRMLAIMRDPHIGAHGATALVLCLLGKVLAVSELIAQGNPLPLIAASTCARFCALPLLALFPYARETGIGTELSRSTRSSHLVGGLLFSALLVLALDLRLLLPASYAVVTALALAMWINARLGGLTGDVYGAAIELSELVFLVASDLAVTG